MRVFLIEDDEMILRALQRILRPRFSNLCTFSDPEAALAQARVAAPDLVISDYSLPRKDGVELLAQIRAANPSARTVILSGNIRDDRINAGLASGLIDYFMSKPWRHEELVAMLATMAAV